MTASSLNKHRYSYVQQCSIVYFTENPTQNPTTKQPSTAQPTTKNPTTKIPTNIPTFKPTTLYPTLQPTNSPILFPTNIPTTHSPTHIPTTLTPTTYSPTIVPTTRAPAYTPYPTPQPTTLSPTTLQPTNYPSRLCLFCLSLCVSVCVCICISVCGFFLYRFFCLLFGAFFLRKACVCHECACICAWVVSKSSVLTSKTCARIHAHICKHIWQIVFCFCNPAKNENVGGAHLLFSMHVLYFYLRNCAKKKKK